MVYNIIMIKSFEHKGLKNFFETGSTKGIQRIHADRLSLLLMALNSITQIEDLRAPSFRLHKLKGSKKELWSITVQANWRITFKFKDENVYVVNYTDYH
jgi:toxin HigB-1